MKFKSLLKTLFIFFVLLILFSLWSFYSIIRPYKIKSTFTPSTFGIPYSKVAFRTTDGLLIKGWFIPSPKPDAKTIILLHGYPADKGNILPSRLFLHNNYNLLFFDFRYHGESEGLYTTVGKNEVLDLLAAIDYLKTKNIHEVGVWGFSMGGSVALMAAEKAPEIKAIISESGYADLNLLLKDYYKFPILKYSLAVFTEWWAWLFLHNDIKKVLPAETIKHLSIPILIIHSENDNVISFSHAELLKKALKNNKNAFFIVNQNLLHGEQFEQYEQKINSFFDTQLK